jgi:hypothetical protein
MKRSVFLCGKKQGGGHRVQNYFPPSHFMAGMQTTALPKAQAQVEASSDTHHSFNRSRQLVANHQI